MNQIAYTIPNHLFWYITLLYCEEQKHFFLNFFFWEPKFCVCLFCPTRSLAPCFVKPRVPCQTNQESGARWNLYLNWLSDHLQQSGHRVSQSNLYKPSPNKIDTIYFFPDWVKWLQCIIYYGKKVNWTY